MEDERQIKDSKGLHKFGSWVSTTLWEPSAISHMHDLLTQSFPACYELRATHEVMVIEPQVFIENAPDCLVGDELMIDNILHTVCNAGCINIRKPWQPCAGTDVYLIIECHPKNVMKKNEWNDLYG